MDDAPQASERAKSRKQRAVRTTTVRLLQLNRSHPLDGPQALVLNDAGARLAASQGCKRAGSRHELLAPETTAAPALSLW